MDTLRKQLQTLGADHVVTYSELADKDFKAKLADWTSSSPLRLALNCVGGQDTSNMAKLLHKDGTLVTYGAMSMKPLSLSSSLFIFKNLKSLGFWMTTWYGACTEEQRLEMTSDLVQMIENGKLKEPDSEIVDLKGNNEDIANIAKKALQTVKGKKIIFRFPDD